MWFSDRSFILPRLKHRLLNIIRYHPAFFFPLMQLNKQVRGIKGVPLINKETELVIEGFFRAANTFTALAFVQAQSRKVVVANHTHAPATIIRAVQWNIPTLLLIREPEATVISLLLKNPMLLPYQALNDYIRYYSKVLPLHHGYVVATFEDVTTELGLVIARVNQQFNTNFSCFEHTEENVQAIFNRIKATDEGDNQNDVRKYSLPVDEKEEFKDRLREQMKTPSIQQKLEQASQLYERYMQIRQTQTGKNGTT
jgi:uncharacterized protein YueI